MRTPLFAGLSLLAATSANAATIDFEGYADPTNVASLTTSGATFSGVGDTTGLEISAYTGITSTWGTAGPMVLCARGPQEYCGGSLAVDFSSAVTNLQFYFSADDDPTSLSVEAFLTGNSLGILTFPGDANPFTSQLVDLSSLGTIDRVVITTPAADFLGYVYDDFSFSFAAVPEPGTWVTMLLGFGAVGYSIRRRKRAELTFHPAT